MTGVTSNEKVRKVFCDLLPGTEQLIHTPMQRGGGERGERLTDISSYSCEILWSTEETALSFKHTNVHSD